MPSVHRVSKRVRLWWFAPLGLTLLAAGVLLWPKTQPAVSYLVATKDLPAGAQVTTKDFEPLTLGEAFPEAVYLNDFEGSVMLTRSLSKGELLAGTAVTKSALDRRSPVVLSIPGGIAHSMRVGSTVDVWATTQASEPVAIALDATVLQIEQSNSLGRNQTSIELAVASEYLPALMQAKATDSFLEVLLQPTLADR